MKTIHICPNCGETVAIISDEIEAAKLKEIEVKFGIFLAEISKEISVHEVRKKIFNFITGYKI
jgi:hypothetical protein